MPGHPFYSTKEWREARFAALVRAGFCCEFCGANVARRSASRVDHIKPRAERPDLALDPGNLRVLCVPCDARRHANKGGAAVARSELGMCDALGQPLSPAHPWNAGAGHSQREGGGR